EFGRFAEDNRKRRGEGKPETFDFLGFTHICGETRKGKWFTVRRQTIKKRLRSKLQAVRQELRKRWHERIAETGEWLRSVVQGYFNYHAVPGNFAALQTFRREIARAWLEALRRRSQRHRLPWERFRSIIDRYLPLPRILHPEPGVRFDAKQPRLEPYALKCARTDLCGGRPVTDVPTATEQGFFLNLLAWSFDDFFLRYPQAVRQAVDFR